MLRADAAGRGLVIDESNWFHPKLVPVGDYRNQQELKQLLRAPISVQGPLCQATEIESKHSCR